MFQRRSDLCWTCWFGIIIFWFFEVHVHRYHLKLYSNHSGLKLNVTFFLQSCVWEPWGYIATQYQAVCLYYTSSCLHRRRRGRCSSPLRSAWWWWWWFWWHRGPAESALGPPLSGLCLAPSYLHFLWRTLPLPHLQKLMLRLMWTPWLLPLLPEMLMLSWLTALHWNCMLNKYMVRQKAQRFTIDRQAFKLPLLQLQKKKTISKFCIKGKNHNAGHLKASRSCGNNSFCFFCVMIYHRGRRK